MSDVEPERVEWLWAGRIPLGKLTILEGDPGTGKSTLTIDLIARLTRGEAPPGGGDVRKAAGAVLWTAEDGLADTVQPRLVAAGARLDRVGTRVTAEIEAYQPVPVTIEELEALAWDVKRVDAKLVVIDPLVAYLPVDAHIYNDSHVRQALTPLARFADQLGVAVVLVRHLHKRATGNPIYAGGGSIGFTGAARSVLLCAKDPDDPAGERRVLARTKGNLAREVPSLAFRLKDAGGTCALQWGGESAHTAESLLREPDQRRGNALGEAQEAWRAILADGSLTAKQALSQLAELGISGMTARRAREQLGIKPRKVGKTGPWVVELPPEDAQTPEGAHSEG
jgi:hypothetical protein